MPNANGPKADGTRGVEFSPVLMLRCEAGKG